MKYNLSVPRIVTPLVFFLLLLTGCISLPSSPPARFYALESIKETGGAAITDAANLDGVVIGIGPVTLPEYYNRPQMVIKNSDGTIEFAQFDRWGEPLHEAMARVIAQNFSVLIPKLNLEIFPWNSAIPVRYQVIMKVIQLECRLDGDTVMLMQWSILDARDKKMLFTKRSEYRRQPGSRSYAGLVQAVSIICEAASRDIAQALAEVAKQGPAAAQ